jgi:hypothetical protein
MSFSPGNESEAALGPATSPLDAERLWELIQVGRGLVAELDMGRLIGELLEVARRVTGARYAAMGILHEPDGARALHHPRDRCRAASRHR